MIGERSIVFVVAVLTMMSCRNTPEVEVRMRECAALPSGGRAAACACSLNGKGYVFSGRDEKGHYLNDLWCYEPETDSWTCLGKAPMTPRVNATITAYGDKLYAGLGYSSLRAYNDTAYQRDWWEYSPSSGEWKRLADFPNANTVAALSFAIGDKLYAIYGFGYNFTRDICRYDVASDSWEELPDHPDRPNRNFGGRGTWLNGLYYYGTGYATYSMNHWYVSDIVTEKWERCSPVPGKGRQFCACTASAKYVYLFGGRHFAGDLTGGEVFDTYLRFSPDQNQWEWCNRMPCGRAENQIAFSIDGKAYVGFGENEKGEIIDRLYRVED